MALPNKIIDIEDTIEEFKIVLKPTLKSNLRPETKVSQEEILVGIVSIERIMNRTIWTHTHAQTQIYIYIYSEQ